jgi:hypothetical protein
MATHPAFTPKQTHYTPFDAILFLGKEPEFAGFCVEDN